MNVAQGVLMLMGHPSLEQYPAPDVPTQWISTFSTIEYFSLPFKPAFETLLMTDSSGVFHKGKLLCFQDTFQTPIFHH
jgi:hypothetical protein